MLATHLRAMNMLYEGMKDKATTIIVPSSALETMNLGAINMAALQGQLQIDPKTATQVAAPKSPPTPPAPPSGGYLPGQI